VVAVEVGVVTARAISNHVAAIECRMVIAAGIFWKIIEAMGAGHAAG
jgi:hypothetical protein